MNTYNGAHLFYSVKINDAPTGNFVAAFVVLSSVITVVVSPVQV